MKAPIVPPKPLNPKPLNPTPPASRGPSAAAWGTALHRPGQSVWFLVGTGGMDYEDYLGDPLTLNPNKLQQQAKMSWYNLLYYHTTHGANMLYQSLV